MILEVVLRGWLGPRDTMPSCFPMDRIQWNRSRRIVREGNPGFCAGPQTRLRTIQLLGSPGLRDYVRMEVIDDIKPGKGTFACCCTDLVWMLSGSMIVTLLRGGFEWRGTFYRLKELRQGMI
jgi:hypothetical protein